eukprot:5340481-Pyramimonas_sp.AAC.2
MTPNKYITPLKSEIQTLREHGGSNLIRFRFRSGRSSGHGGRKRTRCMCHVEFHVEWAAQVAMQRPGVSGGKRRRMHNRRSRSKGYVSAQETLNSKTERRADKGPERPQQQSCSGFHRGISRDESGAPDGRARETTIPPTQTRGPLGATSKKYHAAPKHQKRARRRPRDPSTPS